MKRIRIVLLLLLSFLSVYGDEPQRRELKFGGYDREYLMQVPSVEPRGILVALHGFNRTNEDFFNSYAISELTDSLGYILLAPQALPEQNPVTLAKAEAVSNLFPIPLNAVWGCGLRVEANLLSVSILDVELNSGIDDVGFLDSMISVVMKEQNLRVENIFMLGTSMGGFMSYRYALRQPIPLQGLISIAGSMGTSIGEMDGNKRVPICDFHSLTDSVVPYNGEMRSSISTIRLAQPKLDVLSYWSSTNGTVATPLTESVNNYLSTNDITVSKLTYVHATNEILHYRITGAPHDYFFHRDSGDCMDYAEEILSFIHRHEVAPSAGAASIAEDITIYPNPSRDIVHIGVDQGDVRIYDYSGRLVLSVRVVNGLLDISSLRAGTYLLHLEFAGTRHVMKLMKE